MNNSQMKTNTLPAKLKAERPMPKWVTEANERIGPKPPAPPPNTINGTPRPPALPPKKNQLEPDYEVIEFSGQQYSNEPMRPKTPDTRRPESVMKCTLCGSNNPWVTCDECAQQIFCASCDDMFHKHPKRKTHLRKAIEFQKSTNSTPLIPPKAAPAPQAPVAPPRRNKRGMPSPMPLRRDQVIGSPGPTPTPSPVPGQPQAWQDRLGSLKRGLNLSTRPLPETPRTPSDGVSSRSTTPNSKSVFDAIQRPPSITLEKIKNKASATLDRMALLQQRYRQHKEMKANGQVGSRRDQLLASDQWSNISSSPHFRSGSMSSGINSFDFPDDPPFHFHQQMGMRNSPSARNMSTSVFNLNQVSQRPTDHHSPMWMGGSQMQQAQSMAQLNCINCTNQQMWNQPHQHEEWPGASNTNLNRSQMSLNMAHGFYPGAHPQQMMHPPPIFMNMPGMYPYPMGVGMPAMNPGLMGMPSSTRSRATSRAGSRVPSPTLSRKSIQMRKKRNNYPENELTDDEDSDNDDRRSLISQRSGLINQRRTRRVSSASQALPLGEEEEPRSFRSVLNTRDRRGASIPKSVQSEWTPARRTSTASTNFNSYKKVYSDSPISPDSEASEAPPTRALVQAKIQEKLKESTMPSPPPKAESLPERDEAKQLPAKNPFDVNEYQNSNELKLVVNQNEETIEEDTVSLGPPPSTPEHEWECEFCTFVNEAKTKICSICCKTPINPILKVETATATATTTATVSKVTNGIGKLKVSPSEDESDDYNGGAKKKDNATVEDIWATLDENIQAEANKRTAEMHTINRSEEQNSNLTRASGVAKEKRVQKVSTGCGPSPPKEVVKELRSTATSAVPQSISTQTYDCEKTGNETRQETMGTSTEMRTNEHQSQSYTPPTRNFSPKETFVPVQDMAASREAEHFANIERNIQFYRDMSVTQGDRYRSSNDIRFDDHTPFVGQRRPSVSDYLATQKAQMYHNDNFFDQYAVSKRNEPTRDPEIELFMLLKEAEHYKFTAEELHAALKHCGDTHPIVWLRENWSKLVQTVQSLATKYGQERIENVIGTISAIEAREALRMHGGNVWQAISECVEQRQRKYLEISAKGNYSREDIVTALTAHHGNLELALLDLSKTQLKPFLMRVWGSPGGVENESANYMLPLPTPPPPPPKTEVNSAIHEFLSANADQLTFTQDQGHFRNTSSISNLSSWSHESKDESYVSQNKNVLKDLEILIGNMEQVQAKQSGQLMRSVEDMLGNLLAKKPAEAEMDAESERIFMKSPILSQKIGGSNNVTDVKNFVWQHIQDIVPNLVEQVEKELLEEPEEEKQPNRPEPPPIDAAEFIMEEVIKPNMKHSTIGEEPQIELQEVEAMSNFSPETDRSTPRKQKDDFALKSFVNAPRSVFKVAIAPESSSEEESSEDLSSEEENKSASQREEIVRTPESTKNETSLGNQDDAKERQGESSEDESGDSQKPSTSVEEKPPTERQPSSNNDEIPSSKNEQASSEDKQATNAHEKAPNAEDLPLSNKETEGEAIDSDESENKADKGWGFRGFSFRIGFNSFGRSRRQRSRRSVKREKRKVENEKENDNVAASSVGEVQVGTNDVVSAEDENTSSDKGDQIQSVVDGESVREENALSAPNSLSSYKAEDIQPDQASQISTISTISTESPKISEQPKELQSTSDKASLPEPTSTKSAKSPRKSSSLPKFRQSRHQASTEPTASSSSSAKGSSTLKKTDQDSTDMVNHKPPTEESDLKVADAQTPSKVSMKSDEKLNQTTETTPRENEKGKTGEDTPGTSSSLTNAIIKAKPPQTASTSSKRKIKPSDGVKQTAKKQQNSSLQIKETDKGTHSDTEEASTSALSPSKHRETVHSGNSKETPKPKPNSSSNLRTASVDSQQQTIIPNTQVKNEAGEDATAGKVTDLQSTDESIVSVEPKDAAKAITTRKAPVSRIPIRRTTSTASLISTESIPTSPILTPNVELPQISTFKFDQQSSANAHQFDDDEFFDDIQSSSEEEPDFHNAVEEIVQLTTAPAPSKVDGETSDQELYSVESDELGIENTRDQMQSPTSESEVLLILENEQSPMPLVTPSGSSSTITGVSNKSINFKYADPSKQNLSELVEDTQRLIKQMKEEINIDMAAFDSEDDYSEDYSYEEYEEEYEEEESEDDNVDDEQEYEEEETENEEEEDYSNVELDSGGEGTDEHERFLKDVEEVDEMQSNDEASQIILRHTPSTDHLPSIVDSSILTNLSHVISTDHNVGSVLVIPGSISNGSLLSETDHNEVVESNKMSEPSSQEVDIPGEIEAHINSSASISDVNDNTIPLSIQSPEQSGEFIKAPPAQEEASSTPNFDVPSSTNAIKQRPIFASQIDIVLEKPADETIVANERSSIISVAMDSRALSAPIDSEASMTPDSGERSTSRSQANASNSSSEANNAYLEATEWENIPQTFTNSDEAAHTRSPTPNAPNSLSETLGDSTSGTQSPLMKDTNSVTPEKDSISENLADSNSPTPDTSHISPIPLPPAKGHLANTNGAGSAPDNSNRALTPVNAQEANISEKLPKTDKTTLDTNNRASTSSPSVQDNFGEKLSNTETTQPTGTEILVPSSVGASTKLEHEDTPALINALEQLLHSNNNDTGVNDRSDAPSSQPKGTSNEIKQQESPTQTFPTMEKKFENSVRTEETPSSSSSNANTVPPVEGNRQSEEADDVPSTSKATSPRKSPSKKIASKIPKLNVKPQNPVPTRSKSFSGPSPIGISSVRAIQQELFNKPKPATQLIKAAPPTLMRKKSIIDAISKFTQATTEHPVQRSRTQPKIPKLPKKKYHETCFSDDDYQATTSEDEAPPPLEVRLRKQSAPVFRTYPSIQEPQIEKPEVLARRFVDEQLVSNLAEAHLAAALVGMKFQQDVSIWAAKECADLDQAISMLQQDCELCMGSYPMNQIVSMLKCTHKCCKVCAKNYFTIQITDRSINDCNCPFCKTPELHDPNINEDENLEYFSNLDIFIKNIVEPEVHELFQRKLRDRTLMQDPNFKWCIQCSSGFFARPKQKRLICPDCGSVTCSQCRKTWEKQHETLSCEKFQEWKEANDPEVQAKGVAEHLAINGIDCPKCHFKYSLARGGCMHFTCTQCKHEFCYGCSRPFMMGAKCTISPYCSKLGLHSHHPRSCLFYLRDKDPGQLQNLLKQNNVTFDVDPVGFDKENGARSMTKCPIPLQKETPKGLVDTVCNADVQLNHAGLCRQHYVEYLAGKVSKAGIDPLPILDLTDCVQELRRRGLPLPERGPWDTDEIYRNMCSKVIREKIPIE